MNTWTIAYRKPRANHFKRVTNWSGTWHQAHELAGAFAVANPDLQVYYVPTLETERAEAARIAAGNLIDFGYSDDWGNVMVDSGRRVKIRETGQLDANILAKVPDAAEAEVRFGKGAH